MTDAIDPQRVMLTADAVGGVWHYTAELAAGFAGLGAQVLVVAMGPGPSTARRAEMGAIDGLELRVTDLPLDWLADSAEHIADAAERLAEIAAEWEAETVQLHSPAYAGVAGWPCPVIAGAHSCVATWWQAVRDGALPDDLVWRASLVAQGLVEADAVLAPSHSFARQLLDVYDLEREIRVVWNGRNPFQVERDSHPHGFTAGRLWDEAKNIATLDEAAGQAEALVRAAGPTVGPNRTAASCRHLKLLGPLGQAGLAREYSRAAVFVSPALYEPFGLAVLEAAQAGCPLLLSDIPTFRELWDGVAYFVEPRDTERLGVALRCMLDSPDVAEPLGKAAQRRARRYSRQAMVDAVWGVHREVLGASAVFLN